MKSILLVYNDVPKENFYGGHIRAFNIIKGLSKRNKLTLLTRIKNKEDEKYIEKLKDFCEIVVAPCSFNEFLKKGKIEFLKYVLFSIGIKFKELLFFNPLLIRKNNHQIFWMRKKLKELLRKDDFDFIQVEGFYIAEIVRNIKTESKKIIDSAMVYSLLNDLVGSKKKIVKYEKKLGKMYDLSLCCSKIDKERLQNLGHRDIFILPNGTSIKKIKSLRRKNSKKSLLFAGDLKNKFNFEAIKYFFKYIYPYLNSSVPINIIGEFSQEDFSEEKRLKNVNFLGFVEDTTPYFKNSIFICPILDGGGTRVKILTACSLGSPVVSTLKGAEGIEYNPGEDILIGDSPKEFLKQIDSLLNDKKLYDKIKRNARKLVEDKYGWDKIVRSYDLFLDKYMENRF